MERNRLSRRTVPMERPMETALDIMRIDAYNAKRREAFLKRKDLVKILEENGFVLDRHGHDHDLYRKGKVKMPIPRHTEISENLAKTILRKLGIL